MFKLSLPVQRFVITCVILMILIIGVNILLDAGHAWSDHVQDLVLQSRI